MALGLLGCALPLGSEQADIVGGNLDDGHDLAVVIVQLQTTTQDQVVLCTGTLITPRVVLLAAHCLLESPIASSRIVFADSWDSSTGIYQGALTPMVRNTTASSASGSAAPPRIRRSSSGSTPCRRSRR